MRERWFADDRDLVKWATLVSLATQHAMRSIAQVAYRRVHETVPTIEIDGATTPVPPDVWRFFRDLRRIRELGTALGVEIDVIDDIVDAAGRDRYVDGVLERVERLPRPRLVFLDPDTGLQPAHATAEHTTRAEVIAIWRTLGPGELLVLYQHARRTKTWADDVLQELRTLCPDAAITIARSREVGRDVVFFALRKA